MSVEGTLEGLSFCSAGTKMFEIFADGGESVRLNEFACGKERLRVGSRNIIRV